MAATDSPEPNTADGVISVSTSDVDTAMAPPAGSVPAPPAALAGEVGVASNPAAGVVDPETGEAQVWQGRYAFGNFAGRFLGGFVLIGLTLYFLYKATDPAHGGYRPLVYILGVVTPAFWLYLVANIFRSRLGHHYRLTSRRLFVCSGIFRRHEDMMELEHLKEVRVQQEKMLDRVCRVGHVVVDSNVAGSPTLLLVGVNEPQVISDLIYKYARG